MFLLALHFPFSHAEEISSIDIEPQLLSIIDYTSTEWYENTTNRAILAACAWADVVLSENAEIETLMSNAIWNGYVYVSKKGVSLAVMYCTDAGCVLASYVPATDELSLRSIDVQVTSKYVADLAMENLINEGLVSSYHEIEGEDILTVLEALLGILEE